MFTNNYYAIARNDYLFLQSIKDSEFYNKIAIESQQVVEKYLKHVVDYYFSAKYPGDEFIAVTKERSDKCVVLVNQVREKVEAFIDAKQYCIKCGLKLTSEGACTNQYCMND